MKLNSVAKKNSFLLISSIKARQINNGQKQFQRPCNARKQSQKDLGMWTMWRTISQLVKRSNIVKVGVGQIVKKNAVIEMHLKTILDHSKALHQPTRLSWPNCFVCRGQDSLTFIIYQASQLQNTQITRRHKHAHQHALLRCPIYINSFIRFIRVKRQAIEHPFWEGDEMVLVKRLGAVPGSNQQNVNQSRKLNG